MKSILWFTCSICLMLSTHVYSNAAETSINNSCSSCHTDFKKQLGKKHPNVNAGTIADCMACHGKSASTESFTLKIHGPHVSSQSSVKCTLCHEIVPDERFSVIGSSKNMGKPTADDVELVKNVMNDTVNGKFMAAGHFRNGVSCASCHGASLPVKGDTVANDKCLACHVSYEALAEKTKPKGAHGANPHKSHLDKIDCTVCHFGHQKSVVYCKDCHSKFNPKIPFGQ